MTWVASAPSRTPVRRRFLSSALLSQQFALASGRATWQAILDAADRLTPRLRHAVYGLLRDARQNVDAGKLLRALAGRDDAEILGALGLTNLADDLRKILVDFLGQAALDGVKVAHAQLPAMAGGIRYDLANPDAVAWAHQHAADLVTNLVPTDRAQLRQTIAEAFGKGASTDDLARQLRASVGLSQRDAIAADRLRAAMIAKGTSPTRADKVTDSYRARLIRQRAETIARTEMLTASNMGQQLLWESAIRDGSLPAGVQKRWLTAHDDRLCSHCAALDGVIIPLHGDFTSATLKTTTLTPPLHPSCRCTTVLDQSALQ